jgi:TRAP-type uncharacterized transport system substrate-binding protein
MIRPKKDMPAPANAERLSAISTGETAAGQYIGLNIKMRTVAANTSAAVANVTTLASVFALPGISRQKSPAAIGKSTVYARKFASMV